MPHHHYPDLTYLIFPPHTVSVIFQKTRPSCSLLHISHQQTQVSEPSSSIRKPSLPPLSPSLSLSFSLSLPPLSALSSHLLLSPRRVTRQISKTPFKVLDAPELQDDFYLNLLDWSSLNLLAVGLGSAVYLWNASTCQVRTLLPPIC